MTKKVTILALLFSLGLSSHGLTQVVFDLDRIPYPIELYKDVDGQYDRALQLSLEKQISLNPRWQKLVSQKKLAVGLVDLRDPSNFRYAAINENHMMYAASLPKIAVLLTVMEEVQGGCLSYDQKLQDDLRLMIAKSNNAATTRSIDRVGFTKIANTLTDPKYKLYDPLLHGGLWVGKRYAKSGKKNPDPLKGLSHAATVRQVARFYLMLAYGKLVDDYANNEMLRYLKDPEINHKFIKTLRKRCKDCDYYRKSGSWKDWHSDSVLVHGSGGRKYILIALVKDARGSIICQNLVDVAEKALKLNQSGPQLSTSNSPMMIE